MDTEHEQEAPEVRGSHHTKDMYAEVRAYDRELSLRLDDKRRPEFWAEVLVKNAVLLPPEIVEALDRVLREAVFDDPDRLQRSARQAVAAGGTTEDLLQTTAGAALLAYRWLHGHDRCWAEIREDVLADLHERMTQEEEDA